MAAPSTAFPYTPSSGAILFSVNGVQCAIDLVLDPLKTRIRFGLLERSGSVAWWMGANASSEGNPFGMWETKASPVYDFTASLQKMANDQGITPLVFMKGGMNDRLATRFPDGGTVEPAPGNFASDDEAMAWLISKLPANFKFEGGKIV